MEPPHREYRVMLRIVAIALMAACVGGPAWAQAQTAPAQQTGAATKSVAKKPASKAKPVRPVASSPPAERGPCDTGVIAAVGDTFAVQKIGLTVFGNELTDVPVSWGFDDLVFARAKAIGGARVRRISYPAGAFDAYYHPKSNFLRAENEKLENVIRQIAGSAGCERYLVVTRVSLTSAGTNQTTTGMGVLNFGSSLYNKTMIFDSVWVQLFDGQTFEKRRAPSVSFKRVLDNLSPNRDDGPSLVDNSAYPANAADAANSTILRDGARGLLTRKMDRSLPIYFATETQDTQ
jgi:hypothetical protein